MDTLSTLRGDGDSCIYRIRPDRPNDRVKIKLHHLSTSECDDEDHVYLIANHVTYGPYCHQKPKAKIRHRRYDAFTSYTNNGPDAGTGSGTSITSTDRTVRLCNMCNSDADCGEWYNYWMKCGSAGRCVCGNDWIDDNGDANDGCEQFQYGYKQDDNQCGDGPPDPPPTTVLPTTTEQPATTTPAPPPPTTTDAPATMTPYAVDIGGLTDDGEVEGTFKADEVDVIYVTAPGGYKFRFKFQFEWELIQTPGNGTVPVIVGQSPYTYEAIPKEPEFDEYGIPTEYTAMCTPGDYAKPSNAKFAENADKAVDSEKATESLDKFGKAMVGFDKYYTNQFSKYCTEKTQPSDTTGCCATTRGADHTVRAANRVF